MHPNIIEYTESKTIEGSFYALLGALFRGADCDNALKIEQAWPEFTQIFRQRYHAPGGALDEKEKGWVYGHYGIEEV